MKATFAVIGSILLLAIVIVAFTFGDFFMTKFFAPKYEGVRYDVHKESQSYRDGMTRRLRNLQLEYQKASPEHKQVIASTIKHEVADMDLDRLPGDLRQFITSL